MILDVSTFLRASPQKEIQQNSTSNIKKGIKFATCTPFSVSKNRFAKGLPSWLSAEATSRCRQQFDVLRAPQQLYKWDEPYKFQICWSSICCLQWFHWANLSQVEAECHRFFRTSHLIKLYCSSTATAPSDSTSLLLKACKRVSKRVCGPQRFRSLAWQGRTVEDNVGRSQAAKMEIKT